MFFDNSNITFTYNKSRAVDGGVISANGPSSIRASSSETVLGGQTLHDHQQPIQNKRIICLCFQKIPKTVTYYALQLPYAFCSNSCIK